MSLNTFFTNVIYLTVLSWTLFDIPWLPKKKKNQRKPQIQKKKTLIDLYYFYFFFIFQTGSESNTVFLVYNDAGDEQLGLTVGNDIVLHYNDMEAKEDFKNMVKFNTSINDGRWVKKKKKQILILNSVPGVFTFFEGRERTGRRNLSRR